MTLDPAPPELDDPGPGDDGASAHNSTYRGDETGEHPSQAPVGVPGPGLVTPSERVLAERDLAEHFRDDEARVRAVARRQWLRRRDLERQLHDGAALRISALALRLGLLRHVPCDGEQGFRRAVEDLQDELHEVLQELRDVAGRLYPPLLDEAGLGPALREVAGRSAVPVRVDAPAERFGPAVEGAAYFAVLGCLTGRPPECLDGSVDGSSNGAAGCGHAAVPDRSVEVVIRREGDALVLLVSGVDACHAASIHDGVRLLGGTVAVRDPAVGPTPITVRIPCV
jgi:Histidine kinase